MRTSQGDKSAGHLENSDNSTDIIDNCIGGFTLKWHVKGSNTTEDNGIGQISKEQIWEQKYDPVESNTNVMTLMRMVRESRKNDVDEKDVWKSLLKQRWTSDIIKDSPCLSEDQEYDVILKTAQALNLDNGKNTWVSEEDMAFGKELLYIIKCQFPVVEAAKLSQFFKHLLNNQNLNTVVASTLRNIQPMAGDNINDFSAINMWYEKLDTRYNFSFGQVVLPMQKTDTLTQLAKADPPYLKDIKTSIDERQFDNISAAFGKNSICS